MLHIIYYQHLVDSEQQQVYQWFRPAQNRDWSKVKALLDEAQEDFLINKYCATLSTWHTNPQGRSPQFGRTPWGLARSRVVACKDNYSIRLSNLNGMGPQAVPDGYRIDPVDEDTYRRPIRLSCQEIILLAGQLLKASSTEKVKDGYFESDIPPQYLVRDQVYELLAATHYSADQSSYIQIGYEPQGCPKKEDPAAWVQVSENFYGITE